MQLPGEFSPSMEKSGFLLSGRGVTPPFILSGPTTKKHFFYVCLPQLRESPSHSVLQLQHGQRTFAWSCDLQPESACCNTFFASIQYIPNKYYMFASLVQFIYFLYIFLFIYFSIFNMQHGYLILLIKCYIGMEGNKREIRGIQLR